MNDNFPKLKVIPINKLILHEKADEGRVKKLVQRIKSDGYFKNPIIAAEFSDHNSKFLVLDGVHRTKALAELGCYDIAAQIVDYFDKRIKVYTWDHLLLGCSQKKLLAKIRNIPGLKLIKTGQKEAENLLKGKKIVGYLLFENKEIFAAMNNNDFKDKFLFRNFSNFEIKNRIEKLNTLMSVCETVSDVDRILKRNKNSGAVLVMPNYNKKDIIRVAKRGLTFPAGVTRHIIPNRVLGLDICLLMLKNGLSLSLKNKLLEKFIQKRIKDKRIRFYSEPVFIFDE